MRFLYSLVFLALVAGCGDDSTQSSAGDMSVPKIFDASGQPTSCSATGVAQSCASASGNSGCFVCDLSGAGVCARVCSLLAPNECAAGQTCRELSVGDGGTASGIAVEGAGCAGFGYCH
jgi:hypothetical protein